MCVMRRRDVLRTVATASVIVTGAAGAGAASGADEVDPQDHCHEYCCEDCGDHECGDNCVCEVWCYM